MHPPKSLVIITVVGLSVLIAAYYALRSGNDEPTPAVSVHENNLQQEIDHLRQTNDKLSADFRRLQSNRDQAPAGHIASATPDMRPTAAAPLPPSGPMTSGESPSMGDELPERMSFTVNYPTLPELEAAKLTPAQSAFFESMKQRLNDPSFLRTLNLYDLTQMEEMKTLPPPLRQALVAKAVEKYNRKEVDDRIFLSGMVGYSP